MSDFCKQCSIGLFGEDHKELANMSTPEDTAKELFAPALCEGCGATQVDHEGKCVVDDCLENGHEGKGQHS